MLVLIILLLVSVVFYAFAPEFMEKGFMFLDICLMLVSLGYFLYKCRRTNSPQLSRVHLRHSVFFIICFLIVFYQRYVDYLVGLLDLDATVCRSLWIDTSVVAKALSLSTMSLISFFCGYVVVLNRKYLREYHIRKFLFHLNLSSIRDSIDGKFLKRVGDDIKGVSMTGHRRCLNVDLLIYLAYALLAVYVCTVDKNYLFGGYGKVSGTNISILIMLQSSIIAMLVVYSCKYRNQGVFSNASFLRFFSKPLCFIMLYTAVELITGRRTEIVRIICLVLFAYLYSTNRKANYAKLGIAALLVAVIFTFIGIVRRTAVPELGSGMEEMMNMDSVSPFTAELANSVNTLHVAMLYFPDDIGYTYGLTFFPHFLIAFPFGMQIVNSLIPQDIPIYSDAIITLLGLGTDESYGMGSSCMADTYIAFGPAGTCVVFFLFGIFLNYLETGTFVRKASPYFLTLSFGCYSQFPYMSRCGIPIIFLSLGYALIQVAIFVIPILRSRGNKACVGPAELV